MVNKIRASLLIVFVFLTSQSVPGQTPAPPTGKPAAPGLITLTGADEKRAKQLDEQIDKAMKADRWDEAIARAEELLALRTRAGAEALRDGERRVALQDIAAHPRDVTRRSRRLPGGQYHE